MHLVDAHPRVYAFLVQRLRQLIGVQTTWEQHVRKCRIGLREVPRQTRHFLQDVDIYIWASSAGARAAMRSVVRGFSRLT